MLMVLSVPLNNNYQNLPLLEALFFFQFKRLLYNKETNNQSQDLDVRDA